MTFTDKQKEIVARKLGYDGPMQGFDNFLNSSPSLGMKYATLSDKFATRMAKGGVVRKKFAAGGVVSDEDVQKYFAANPGLGDKQIVAAMVSSGATVAQVAKATGLSIDDVQKRYDNATKPATTTVDTTSVAPAATVAAKESVSKPTFREMKSGEGLAFYIDEFKKQNPNPTIEQLNAVAEQAGQTFDAATGSFTGKFGSITVPEFSSAPATTTASQIANTPGVGTQGIGVTGSAIPVQSPTTTTPTTTTPTTTTTTPATDYTTGAPTSPTATGYTPVISPTPTAVAATPTAPTQAAAVTQVAAPTAVAAPKAIVAPIATAATAAPSVEESLAKLQAQQGTVSEEALATAATQAPETTAVAGMEAAQGVAGTVQGAPTRTLQEGEMVSGPAVDMAKVEQTLAQTQAAQGTVTEDMTVQGQLNKMLTGFDAGAPPPWAAASMRTATAQMAARGLGASSLAGQAIIQATLEAATPIAAADAKVFEQMGLQNLSNRQQVAVLVGQQRATFLGQEFDQAFQTRVLNAAKVSDIANKNFDAQTQIAIENSRLANSMDIANLSARNAVVLGKMAQMSQLETANLNNRQQVAVENARAFLTMDIKNLDNRQQTALFKAQELNDALVSDAGFANAISITNSQNKLEADKVSAQLAQSAAQFNADMATKVSMSNALAANELSKFNAQQANAREEFNSNNAAQINIANAKILAEVSTANTAAVNAANAVNAKNATDLAAAKYAQESQTYRDKLEMSWKTGENFDERVNALAIATLTASASTKAAETTANRSAATAIGTAAVAVLTNYDKVKLVYDDAKKIVSGWDKD